MGINQSKAYGRMKEDSSSDSISKATEASISSFQDHIKIKKKELMRTCCCYKKEEHRDCRIPITKFVIKRKIFDRSGGGIFEVIDPSTNLRYAMKFAEKSKLSDNELHNLTVLQGHQNIVDCMHVFETKKHHFIVIEELLTCSLFDFFYKEQTVGNLSFARVVGSELASVLRFMHEKKIIYSDLHLDNVVFNRNGRLKLADFDMALNTPTGFVVFLDELPQNNLGSLAPEQTRGNYNRQTDWFNYGMILCSMIVGKSPNEEFFRKDVKGKIDAKKTMKCIFKNKKDLVLKRNGENDKAAELVDKCLKNKQEERIDLDNDKVFNEVSFLKNITEEERENFREKILEFAKRGEASLYLY